MKRSSDCLCSICLQRRCSCEHHRIVCRIIELKALKLQNGKFSIDEQIEHDKLNSQISYLCEKNCFETAKIVRRVEDGHVTAY
jgi:hypothetical protein